MKYKIIIQKATEKFLKKQPRKNQERLLIAIYKLPEGTDIKKLQGHNIYRDESRKYENFIYCR